MHVDPFFLRASLFLDGSDRPRTDQWAALLERTCFSRTIRNIIFPIVRGIWYTCRSIPRVRPPRTTSSSELRVGRVKFATNSAKDRPSDPSPDEDRTSSIGRARVPFSHLFHHPPRRHKRIVWYPLRHLFVLRPRPPRGYLGEDFWLFATRCQWWTPCQSMDWSLSANAWAAMDASTPDMGEIAVDAPGSG